MICNINEIQGLDIKFKSIIMSIFYQSEKPLITLLSKPSLHHMYIIDVQIGDDRQIAQYFQCIGFPSVVTKQHEN